jgi:hypothetical protein
LFEPTGREAGILMKSEDAQDKPVKIAYEAPAIEARVDITAGLEAVGSV